jgi:hypothetical protein
MFLLHRSAIRSYYQIIRQINNRQVNKKTAVKIANKYLDNSFGKKRSATDPTSAPLRLAKSVKGQRQSLTIKTSNSDTTMPKAHQVSWFTSSSNAVRNT